MPGAISEMSFVNCLIPIGACAPKFAVPYPYPTANTARSSVGPMQRAAVVLALLCAALPVHGQFSMALGNWTTDYATPELPDTPQYDRCKTTHRCNRARATYLVDEGRYIFRKERFRGGRQENADLFLNFEDWKAGTLGLGVDYVRQPVSRRCCLCVAISRYDCDVK